MGAVFIFNPEDKSVDFIRNGKDARFKALIGLAIDDTDRLFVTDSGFRRVFVFDASHKFLVSFGSEKMERPSGVAVDSKNRLVYVTDVLKDNVLVYDLDSFKYIRTIGGPPQRPADDSPGTFTRPTNVAVGPNGDVYVSDTLNGRIQIFDADGTFLSTFGKPGDGPGDFARPKGIAIDSDGHIWVADADQNRVKVFDRKGHLCAFFGEYGYFPGQFALPSGITIDKNNRVDRRGAGAQRQVAGFSLHHRRGGERWTRPSAIAKAPRPQRPAMGAVSSEQVCLSPARPAMDKVEVLEASAAVQTR